MNIILGIILINIALIVILNRRKPQEKLTIKSAEENIYFFLNDDIYLTLQKSKDNNINKELVYKTLENYASELSRICSKVVVLDKFNIISQEKVQEIVCKR